MALTQAHQAVVEYLVAVPEAEPETVSTAPTHRGWVSKVGRERNPVADPTTVRFRKSRAFDECELHSVAFSTLDGRSMESVVRTWIDGNGVNVVAPIGGGSGGGPHRNHPWVNFSAQWNSTVFRGGGVVIGEGTERAHIVRLRFANGTVAEDTIGRGVVLFEVPGPITFPVEVDVLDAGAVLIHSYTEFGIFV
jgi:hypothetical protein